jgi:hypothetical protein
VKSLFFVFAVAWCLYGEAVAQAPSAGAQDPKRAAARAYLTKDPHRKVKNEKGEMVNVDLRPLFAWVNSRKGGVSPMPEWKRFEVTVNEHLKDGMLVTRDAFVFHVKNYPQKLPVGTTIQLFVRDVGTYDHQPKGASLATLHAFDYGIPYTPTAGGK